MSKARAILIGGVVVAVLALAGAAYVYWFMPRDVGSVSLELSKPPQISLGKPFELTASIVNPPGKTASNARLVVSLPAGVAQLGQSPDIRVAEIPLGDIGPSSTQRQFVQLIAVEGVQTIKRLEAKVIYSLGDNMSSQFEATAGEDLTIGDPAISMNFVTPPKVFSGQNFEMKVVLANTTDVDLNDLGLKLVYAPLYRFGSASPAPTTGNAAWTIGTISRGGQQEIKVQGSAVGPDDVYFGFHGELTMVADGYTYTINTQEASIAISLSPLSVTVTAGNGQSDYVASAGEIVPYSLAYRNNSNVTLENVVVTAALSGEMIDYSHARSKGYLNSIANTFTWNPANTPVLAQLAPGESGILTIGLPIFAQYPIKRTSDKNYTVKMHVQIESPTVPEATGATKTVSVTDFETKIAGHIDLKAIGLHKESASGFKNDGPFPARANVPTQYTIHWRLTNYSTDLKDLRVAASLQGNTRFTGVVSSTFGIFPKLNPASGEVSLEVPSFPATKGLLGTPIEVIFQLENTPATNNIGGSTDILGDTKLIATDIFTGKTYAVTAKPITTALPDDPSIDQRNVSIQP